MEILFSNLLIYIVISFIVFKKNKFNLNCFLWMTYAFFSFTALLIYNTPIYNYTVANKISFTPYIYLLICLIIIFYPIYRFKENNIRIVEMPSKIKMDIFIYPNLLIGFILIPLLFPYMVRSLTSDMLDVYTTGSEGLTKYPQYISLLRAFYQGCLPILILYLFYSLTNHTKKKYIIIIFICTFIPGLMLGITNASRGGLFFLILDFIVAYILFRRLLSHKLNKYILGFFLTFGFLLLVVVITITYSRFGEDDGLNSIYRYFGEPFLNFDLIFWGRVKNHPFGERLFFDYLNLFGANIERLPAESLNWHYDRLTGVPTYLFRMIIGDFYIEFGLYGTIFFCFIIMILGTFFIRKSKKKTPFYRLIVFFFYYQMCISGVFGFTKGGHNGFLMLISMVISYVYFRYDFSNLRMKNK